MFPGLGFGEFWPSTGCSSVGCLCVCLPVFVCGVCFGVCEGLDFWGGFPGLGVRLISSDFAGLG